MQGFLDPAYPTHVATDYRSVIDKVLVGLHPRAAYGFGSTIRAINASPGTLSSRAFYGDANTQTEDVLAQIARDTGMTNAYVVVTDGRRGSPTAALNQYGALRSLAETWVNAGGTLVVAASMAPFTTVAADPSGCRRTGETAADQRCPLYAFALGPRGTQRWLVSALAPAFEHVFSWPAMRIAGREEYLVPTMRETSVQFERNWGPTAGGSPIVRSRSNLPVTDWVALKLTSADSVSAIGAGVLAAMHGQSMHATLAARRFDAGPLSTWGAIDANSAIVRADTVDPMSIQVVSRGTTPDVKPTLYRVDLMAGGFPSWLDSFDAVDWKDQLRTFGLGRLFEAFRQDARALSPDTASLARFYIVAN